MPNTMSKPFRGWNADALYFTDNGAVLCGADLGASAMYSGRDISGQKIQRVTPDDVREWNAMPDTDGLPPMRCECCHKAASLLHLPA